MSESKRKQLHLSATKSSPNGRRGIKEFEMKTFNSNVKNTARKIIISKEEWNNLKWVNTEIGFGDIVNGKMINVREKVAEHLDMQPYAQDDNYHTVFRKGNDLYVLTGFNGGTCLYAMLEQKALN